MIHWLSYMNHHSGASACGISVFIWDLPSDPPGTIGADGSDGRVYFAKHDMPENVTCEGCLPIAREEIERVRAHAAKVEAMGGQEAYDRHLEEWMERIKARAALRGMA